MSPKMTETQPQKILKVYLGIIFEDYISTENFEVIFQIFFKIFDEYQKRHEILSVFF